MRPKQIVQKVIDFQYQRINALDETQIQPSQDIEQVNDKFSLWNLSQIIRSFNLDVDFCDIHWIGYGEAYYIDAFVLCLLSGFKTNNEVDNKKFAKIKYSVYQICEKYLTIKEQRILVQKLCSSQYTINITNYLSKNNVLLSLFSKIYKKYIQSLYQCLLPIEELKLFASNFSFLTFQIFSQSSCLVNNFGRKFHIINEKGCVFVVQQSRYKSFLKESLQINQQLLQSLQNSNKKQQFQKSTPKFIPKSENSIMISSKKARLKSISQVNIEGFDGKQQINSKRQDEDRLHFKKIKKYYFKKSQKDSLLYKKSPNLSLRNTIDMHIANLQKYDIRSKKNRGNIHFRSSFFKRQPKSKSKSHTKSKQRQKRDQSIWRKDFEKSKSSGIAHRSPSSETATILNCNRQMQMNQKSWFGLNAKIYSQCTSPKNTIIANQPRVNFTYFSP